MKKLTALTILGSAFLFNVTSVFAQLVAPPSGPVAGVTQSLPVVITQALTIIFVIAALVVLFMLAIGAFQWITSGGEKENVAKARGRITHALIGLAILALAVLITRVVGTIVGINIFNISCIPTLNGGCSS